MRFALILGTILLASCGGEERAAARDDLPAISGCSVTDGDTIRCGNERIRLLGIDAPEKPGHCRKGRNCAPGDPNASEEHLVKAMTSGSLTIERHGKDHYGRTLAHVYAGQTNLSCAQLTSGNAIYRSDWDDPAGRLTAECH